MSNSIRLELCRQRQLRLFIIIGFVIFVLINGCSTGKMKDEENLVKIRSIVVYMYLNDEFSHDLRSYPKFSSSYPFLFSILLKDNNEALDKVLAFHNNKTLSFNRIDPFRILAESEKKQMIKSISERGNLSRELANNSDSDAILWINVHFSSFARYHEKGKYKGKMISPNITWFGELFNKNGKKVWANFVSKKGFNNTVIGAWEKNQIGTQVTTSLKLDRKLLVEFNKIAAEELAASLLDRLTQDMAQARNTTKQ